LLEPNSVGVAHARLLFLLTAQEREETALERTAVVCTD